MLDVFWGGVSGQKSREMKTACEVQEEATGTEQTVHGAMTMVSECFGPETGKRAIGQFARGVQSPSGLDCSTTTQQFGRVSY